MAQRDVAPGCSAQFVHQDVVPIDTWDDETGAITFGGDPGYALRGQYVPPESASASLWPRLLPPFKGMNRAVVPEAVQVRRDGQWTFAIAEGWDDRTQEILVSDSTQRASSNLNDSLFPADRRTIRVKPEDYQPLDPFNWPPVPRPRAERVQSEAPLHDGSP